ncbi:MAG: winged helix-turn-helix transcriptional regulator [Nitrososphaeraceae archaeon]
MQSIKGQEEKSDNSIDDEEIVIQPQVKFVNCPIRTSLEVLGKKWTILIIRDIGVRKIGRFNRLLESILGLTPRVLSMRLKELEKEGLIECVEKKKSPMMVLWRLTEKGKDTLPILIQMVVFASKWYADVIFEDKRPRKFSEIFPQPEAREIITIYI